MSGLPLIQQWTSEFCAPVVVTLATAQVEKICLQNGLLLHELLSCFGHLDGINSVVRVGNQQFPINDTHIRFERVTEVKAKTTENVEELLKQTFTPFDINRLPTTQLELKSSPPSAWTHSAEQIVSRSLSFSEYEMVSHPIIVLSVVATTDPDPLAAMQELTSIQNTPTCFANGQYDSTIQRVFLVVEDAIEKGKDAFAVLRSLSAFFPAASTKLISINSFAASSPNLQQPDMWSRFLIPKYFPNHAPAVDPKNLPLNPTTKKPVLGSRLSVEDFMKLREFCIWLFNEQIVPGLERRLSFLGKQVNDARKGMKNVWKSFFRKPREDADQVNGGVKYRFDKIESQTLVLADLSFMIKDYETASSMYKSLRDDFKSDKSLLHLAHVYLMLALCQLRTEPNKYKEIFANLEFVAQCMASGFDVAHAHSYFALLCSEIYVASNYGRAPLDAARLLLQASGSLARYPVLSSLLIERAASFFMQANQVRKYVLHCVLAGNKLYKCGAIPAQHASVCFASSMMLLEKSNWSDPKAKLSKALSQDLKAGGRERAQRSLIFLLNMLKAILDEGSESGGSLVDAVSVLNEISRDGPWGHVLVKEGWEKCSTRDILLGAVPVNPLDITDGDISKSRAEIEGLSVPEISVQDVEILEPINGPNLNDSLKLTLSIPYEKDLLLCLLEVEKKYVNTVQVQGESDSMALTLEEMWVKAEKEFYEKLESKQDFGPSGSKIKVPLGEKVIVKVRFTNKLPVDLRVGQLQLLMNDASSFVVQPIDKSIPTEKVEEIVLQASPQALGSYHVKGVRWHLSDHLIINQPLHKKGPLLQRSLEQRANGVRGKDTSLEFEVVEASPLLHVQFEGLSPEVLQGQLLKSTLIMSNKGAATATEIYIKLSQPSFVFYLHNSMSSSGSSASSNQEGQILDFFGQSSTVVFLQGVEIQPGQEIRLEAWLRVTKPGLQRISLLLAYQAPFAESSASSSSSNKGPAIRTSFLSVQTRGLPSLGMSLKLVNKPSSVNVCTLIAEVTNYLRGSSMNEEDDPRRSTIGQIDLGNMDDEFMEVDSNCLKVVGMWMIGGGEPFKYSNGKSATNGMVGAYASPAERVVQCFSVKVHGAKSGNSHQTWLIPLPATSDAAFMANSHLHLDKIIESFLCIWYADHEFSNKLQEARITVQMAEDEANAAGPRSIAEVRRERQRQLELKAKNNPSEDWDTVYDEVGTAVPITTPKSVSDIAKLELRKNCVNIATVWVCRWADKIRWGIHHTPHVGLHHTEANAISNIHISIQHPKELTLPTTEALNSSRISVKVTIRSLSYQAIRVSVRAQTNHKEFDSKNGDLSLHRVHNLGFEWVGKVTHEEIFLPAQQDIELDFQIEVLKPGIFDLNKFLVSAQYAKMQDSSSSASTQHTLPGQSLLYVY